ncbi:hypothetical protein ACRASQ_09805 [Bacteroides hominis]|uniref:hypothetical protein n=1 Tax=Bacteroides hominis TaxID=2763023 RepID=UPI003D6B1712
MYITTRYIKNKLWALICILGLFFCRYEVWFIYMPATMLRTLQLFGFGVLCLLFVNQRLHVYKNIGSIITFSICFGIYSLFISFSLLHFEQGTAMFRIVIGILLFLGIYVCIIKKISQIESDLQIGRLLDYWLYTSILQIIISCIFFVNHSFYDYVISILNLPEITAERNDLINIRIMGLGNAFFGAGFNYGIDILVMALLPYVQGSIMYKNKFIYWLVTIAILCVGILSARTFLIGAFCALSFIVYNERKHLVDLVTALFKFLLVILIAVPVVSFLLVKYIDNFESILSWAFEIFINISSGNGLETGSSNKMFDMYNFPEDIFTWLRGDGIIELEDGTYYMHTDIGFIRLIFFWGLPATILFYIYRYYCIRTIYCSSNIFVLKSFAICYLAFEYICNLKGLVFGDSFIAFLLVYIVYFEKRKYTLKHGK